MLITCFACKLVQLQSLASPSRTRTEWMLCMLKDPGLYSHVGQRKILEIIWPPVDNTGWHSVSTGEGHNCGATQLCTGYLVAAEAESHVGPNGPTWGSGSSGGEFCSSYPSHLAQSSTSPHSLLPQNGMPSILLPPHPSLTQQSSIPPNS